MEFYEALEIMKRGGTVTHAGKTFRIGRGVEDVTDPDAPLPVKIDEDDRAATDWASTALETTSAPTVVEPAVVDEVLSETAETETAETTD